MGASDERPGPGSAQAEPAGARDILHAVVAMMAEVLGRPLIGVDENFFQAGGRSMTLMLLLASVKRRFGVAVMPSAFLAQPTAEGLAQLVATGDRGQLGDDLVGEGEPVANLDDVVGGVLGLAPGAVHDDVGPATLADWTSLNHVRLLAAVEDAFGVRFTGRQARSVRSVGDLRRMLRENGVGTDT